MDAGTIPIKTAAEVAALTKEEQAGVVAAVKEGTPPREALRKRKPRIAARTTPAAAPAAQADTEDADLRGRMGGWHEQPTSEPDALSNDEEERLDAEMLARIVARDEADASNARLAAMAAFSEDDLLLPLPEAWVWLLQDVSVYYTRIGRVTFRWSQRKEAERRPGWLRDLAEAIAITAATLPPLLRRLADRFDAPRPTPPVKPDDSPGPLFAHASAEATET
jgi:hypothetical protein